MKKLFLFAAAFAAALTSSGIGVDIYKDANDPRPVSFTFPAKSGEKNRKWVAKVGEKEHYIQVTDIVKYPGKNTGTRWFRAIGHLPPGRVEIVPLKDKFPSIPRSLKANDKNDQIKNSIWTITFNKEPFNIIFERGKQKVSFGAPSIVLPDGTVPQARLLAEKNIDIGPTQRTKEFSGDYISPQGETRYWRLRVTMWNNTEIICVEPLIGVTVDNFFSSDKKRADHLGTDNVYNEMRALKSASMRFADATGKVSKSPKKTSTQWEYEYYEEEQNGKKVKVNGSLGNFKNNLLNVYVPEMAERFPIGMTVDDNTMEVNLLPEIIPVNRYAKREKEYIHYFALRTGNYVMRAGVELSFPIYLSLGKSSKMNALKNIPVGMVDVEELNKTGAWLNTIRKPSPKTALLDKEILVGLKSYFDMEKSDRWYGFMNYGDWFGERKWNWGNQEYDTAAVLFEQALRFRNPEFFRKAAIAARHQMEIDTIKKQPRRNGGIWTHAMGHTGGYYRDGEFKFSNYGGGGKLFMTSKVSNGHMRIRGMAMAYVLTGDQRFHDTACLTGDYIMSTDMFKNRSWRATHREPGWALVNLTSIYWMNPHRRFYKGICNLANIVMEQAKGRGVRYDYLARHNCPQPEGGWKEEHRKFRRGALSFPTGYQATGMYLASQILGDDLRSKDLKDDILLNLSQTADYVKKRLYFPERKGFVHSPVPWRFQSTRNGSGAGQAMRHVLMIDALLTGNKESAEIAKATLLDMIKRREVYASPLKDTDPDKPDAKGVASGIYFIPLTMDLMERLGWTLPETIEYDLSQKTSWQGTVKGMSNDTKK